MPAPAERISRAMSLQQTVPEILAASAEVSREILGVDSTFVAVVGAAGAYPMSITDGIRDPRFREIVVRPGAGLGGQVLLRGRPHRVADYGNDPTISRDFVHVVCEVEGLRGMACVPVRGPDRIEALLYSGGRTAGPPADQTLRTLELVAAYAELSLHQAAVSKQEIELATLRERQRLATELHDSVAQMLFTIGVAAHYSRQQNDSHALIAALEEIEATAATARSELRASLRRLSRPAEGLAFEARLAGEVRLSARTTGCLVSISGRGERRDLAQPAEDLLIDTALEGMRNAVKHERAQHVILHLAYQQESVVLVLRAETGPIHLVPRPRPTAGAGTGTGLALLRERAAQLRGTLELISEPDGHPVLRLELPTQTAQPSRIGSA